MTDRIRKIINSIASLSVGDLLKVNDAIRERIHGDDDCACAGVVKMPVDPKLTGSSSKQL